MVLTFEMAGSARQAADGHQTRSPSKESAKHITGYMLAWGPIEKVALLQATSPTHISAGRASGRNTGQYLPGLAPSTEVRKRASESRQQHLAKLQCLVGGQAAASLGAPSRSSGKQPALLLGTCRASASASASCSSHRMPSEYEPVLLGEGLPKAIACASARPA